MHTDHAANIKIPLDFLWGASAKAKNHRGTHTHITKLRYKLFLLIVCVRESACERQKADAGRNEKAFNYIKKVIFVTVGSCRLYFFTAAATIFVGIVIKMLSSLLKTYVVLRRSKHIVREWFLF
jgi:hypothetical protein